MKALTIITAIGALQGLMLLLFIVFRERHPKNTPLALLLLVFSVRLATIPTWNAETLTAMPWIYPLTAPLPFLFGFLLWWYAREISHDGANRPPAFPVHFLPWLLEVIAVSVTVISASEAELSGLFRSIFTGDPPLWLPVRNGLKVAVNVFFLVLTTRIAFGKNPVRLSAGRRLRLRALVILPAVVLVLFAWVAIIPGASEELSGGSPAPFVILACAMAALIYGLTFLQLVAPAVFDGKKKIPKKTPEPVCPPEECRRLADELITLLEAGAFQDPDMTLRELASRMSVNVNRLSYAVNRTAGIPFRVLLNRRRLEAFLEKAGSAEKNLSILTMAFDAGFPSKSTFNRVFREETGMAPGEFLKSRRRQVPE